MGSDGQLSQSIRNPKLRLSNYEFSQVQAGLYTMIFDIMAFNEIFAHAQDSDRAKIQTPMVLVDAWMHLILALATCLTNAFRSQELMRKASAELKQGLEAMMDAILGPGTLHKHAVVLPLDLMYLMSMRLLRDVTSGLPDIGDTYWSHLLSIVSTASLTSIRKADPHRNPTSSPSSRTAGMSTGSIS